MNRCNLRCSFCPPDSRPAAAMTPAQFGSLLRQIKPHTRYLYLHIKGEPLMHPQLDELLALAAQEEMLVHLTTNGLLLPQRTELLVSAPALRQTNISLHSYTPETHGPLEPWVDSLCDYARRQAQNAHFTVFRFWTLGDDRQPTGWDAQTLALLDKQFPDAGGISYFKRSNERSIALEKGIFISLDRQFDWPGLQMPNHGAVGSCHGGRSMAGILADGTVVPCCLDGDGVCALGNAFTTPLDDILASPRYTALCEGFQKRRIVEPLCQH
ncbi:MAG: radical SAM protein, partial [Angelakisella sp.]